MVEEEAEDAPAQNPADHFAGNIMNFERPKFNARQENHLEALKAFKKKCGYIFIGSLLNISEERKCMLVQDWLGPEGQKIYDSLDWGEGEDVNNYELMRTKLEGAERKPQPGNQRQSRSTKKPFVLKVDEDGEEHFYEVMDNISTLDQQCDHRKAFASLLISKKRISVNFQIDSGSTCSILPVGVYKEISGDHDLQELNTTVRQTLSLFDEKTKHWGPENYPSSEQSALKTLDNRPSAPTILNKPSAKNGMRLCIDFRPLNTALKRSEYPIPTVDHLLTEISNAKVFTLADIKSAFWHVPLDEPSSLLTTFNTPVGRMNWNRMPFGISVAPEEFQKRIDETLEGLEGTKAIADDILIWGDGNTIEEATSNHDARLSALLDRCQQKHIKLNVNKFQLRKT
ncbi:Transposon Ty3-G Gag-Pol polyprotein [Stylophora pistillata]|uniref:Transposon Ty3-G Gag-Pol polyprotein n=1 Tax=Stylophora pistillata TaxID=50429 RepID=A0A2B4RE50_STYPI|nr:Transposon Ty3-G Gag-Pol polyprotein [Stylophora pistillata]